MKDIIGAIELPDPVCNYVQRVFYELEGYKSLIVTLVESMKDNDLENPHFERLKKEYQEKNAEFNLIMSEIKESFLSANEDYRDDANSIMIEVDFIRAIAEFVYKGCTSCKTSTEQHQKQ